MATSAAFMPNYAASATNLRHWEKRSVTVHFAPSAGNKMDPVRAQKLITRALALWNQKIGNAVTLSLTDDAENADVTVSLVKPGSLAGGAIGRTDVTFRLTDQILTHANVRLNDGLGNEEFIQVSAHELGHALGVQGHSNDPHDLMYAYAHVPATITERDLNTMSLSYVGVLGDHPTSATVAANIPAGDPDVSFTGEPSTH